MPLLNTFLLIFICYLETCLREFMFLLKTLIYLANTSNLKTINLLTMGPKNAIFDRDYPLQILYYINKIYNHSSSQKHRNHLLNKILKRKQNKQKTTEIFR